MRLNKEELCSKKLQQKFDKVANTFNQSNFVHKITGKGLFNRLDLIKNNPNVIIDLGGGTGLSSLLLKKTYKNR